MGSLKREPFFQAGAAKCVEAVEQGERLVEDFSTDLGSLWSIKRYMRGVDCSYDRGRFGRERVEE